MNANEIEIKNIVDKETKAWNTKDVNLLLSIFHPDMVWVWPKDNKSHNPTDWITTLGKFDYNRWKIFYSEFFNKYNLIYNKRNIVKIEISKEGDGAFAIVDIDTLWKDSNKNENHWFGRVCKTYVKKDDGWKLISHTGVLIY
jgi:ketosteroid isomerase-like protein